MTHSSSLPRLWQRASCSLLAAALLVSLWLVMPGAQAQERTAVIATRVVTQPWSDPLEALGTLRADESMTLSATVTEIVAELNFGDGEEVEAGQLLVRLEDGEEQAQLRAAQALRDERRNALSRATQLQARNLGSRADVEDSQAQLRQVEAEIEEIEARLASHRLRAPFDGVIGFRNISAGALVTPGMELLTLDKLDVVKLDFSVPEVYLSALHPGLRLTARTAAYPDATFDGEIASVGTRVDPVSRSVSVRAALPNEDRRLRPGMLMTVVLQRRPREALVVPESVLIPSGERHYLFVIDETDDNRLERRQVQVGERRTGEVEIVEGLAAGELVVQHGLQRAREGDRVALLGIADDETTVREILERGRGEENDQASPAQGDV
ncbi:efflux RND transporter periplasmic adaptor subunit [Litchfieldella rifensis]|uniref:Efflux RND transporter periplasmic adaptor subunit n=1 Tax=Litchfieldella rifensis TaxID=762643 RepID=A0ABV7LML8_9GAMM